MPAVEQIIVEFSKLSVEHMVTLMALGALGLAAFTVFAVVSLAKAKKP